MAATAHREEREPAPATVGQATAGAGQLYSRFAGFGENHRLFNLNALSDRTLGELRYIRSGLDSNIIYLYFKILFILFIYMQPYEKQQYKILFSYQPYIVRTVL